MKRDGSAMGFTKDDLRVICIGMRILEDALPYDDEVDEIIDKCKSVFDLDELKEIDEEIDELKATQGMKDMARGILGSGD